MSLLWVNIKLNKSSHLFIHPVNIYEVPSTDHMPTEVNRTNLCPRGAQFLPDGRGSNMAALLGPLLWVGLIRLKSWCRLKLSAQPKLGKGLWTNISQGFGWITFWSCGLRISAFWLGVWGPPAFSCPVSLSHRIIYFMTRCSFRARARVFQQDEVLMQPVCQWGRILTKLVRVGAWVWCILWYGYGLTFVA